MKIFSVLLLTIMVAIAAKKSMAKYLLVKTSDGEDTDVTKPQSYPECRKKQCGDQCSFRNSYGQCNKHGKCIFGDLSGESLNCECGGDLVYRNCHPMCGACNSKGPCREACIKGCGCPREGTNQLLRLSTDSQTCVKKEECPADGEEGIRCDMCPGDPTVEPKFGTCKEGFSCKRDDGTFGCSPGICRKDKNDDNNL